MAILGTLLSFLPACSGKPSATRSYRSPLAALRVVVEDFGGDGPLSADTTRVYAVRILREKTVKQLIVEGEYLGLSRVEWISADQLTLCISSNSMTSSFYNNVTLSDGETSLKVHTTLNQNCAH
jgi:hypothetical protein